MLSRVQIEHELRERALESCEPALQHHEARAGKLGGGLEIHLPERLAEVEMPLRLKSVITLGPEPMVLDVVARVLPTRYFVKRQIRNLRKRVVELLRSFFRLLLQLRDFRFQARDFGKKRLRRRFLVAFLRRADLPRSGVAAGGRRPSPSRRARRARRPPARSLPTPAPPPPRPRPPPPAGPARAAARPHLR